MDLHWSFHHAADWPALASDWEALNARAGNLPFLSTAFLVPLMAEFGNGSETIALGRRGPQPVAGAILQGDGFAQMTTFQPSQLPLGPWIVAEGEDWAAAAQSLVVALPGLVGSLGLTQLDPLLLARPADGARLDTLDYIETGWVDVTGSFDTYWDARGKNLRTNMRKQRSKLEADGVRISFETLTGSADVDAAVTEYGRLESAGWKADLGTCVRPDNAQGRFYAEMLRNFCALGRARIWQLRFDDKVVAMDLCIEAGDTLVVLKTAFDAEHRNVSPAFLMRQEAFREVFESGTIRRIEFYGRLMEWHTRWTDLKRTLYHANVYRWSVIPSLRRWRHRMAARPAAPVEQASSTASN